MRGPRLFEPVRLGGLTLPNRIVISPMCQYSAKAGRMTEWHRMHLGHLAVSGAGLLTIEATAVDPEGRISFGDVGLWDDKTESAIAHVIEGIRQYSDIAIAIQLSHAGRKASCAVPWQGGCQIPVCEGGWRPVAPSAIGYHQRDARPAVLDAEGLAYIREGFATAARRAVRAGVDVVQVHAAHGYLLHQFLSPLSNRRADRYGGDLENRMRFPLEVFAAVRAAVPAHCPVTARLSATDWIEGGWDLEQSIAFARRLEAAGCACIDVSSGGLHPAQILSPAPGYQIPFARAIKRAVLIPVMAVGLITSHDQADAIIDAGDADFVAIARAILYDPRWPWHAAAGLGARIEAPNPYRRAAPADHPRLFEAL